MQHLHKALKEHIEAGVSQSLAVVAEVAHSHGAAAWLVGGMVRDAMLGIQSPHQVPDIVVSSKVHAIADACVERCKESKLLARSMFHTCRIRLGAHTIELAAARRDEYEPHGSLPTVRLVPHILDDLPRRDFTINAMAVELTPDGFGRFHDPFNGREDCANLTLRMLHREAFSEDPTRMLRGIRLAARYGLRFERETAKNIERALPSLSALLTNSPSRLFAEFARWFDPHENMREIVSTSQAFGVTRVLHMEPFPKTKIAALSEIPDSYDADSRFAVFLQILDERASEELSQNLPLTQRWRALLTCTMEFNRILGATDWDALSDSQFAVKLRNFDTRVVLAASMFVGDRQLASRLRRLSEAARRTKSRLNGRDVAGLGIQSGPEIGNILREIVNLRIDGEISTRNEEIEYVRRRIRTSAT